MKINELVVIVDELNLHMGINNNLDAKLSTSIKALDDIKEHNDVAALHSMEAFAQAVEVQRDKFISDALPDMLIEKANEIILWLEWHTGDDVTCPICGGNPCVPPCPCS